MCRKLCLYPIYNMAKIPLIVFINFMKSFSRKNYNLPKIPLIESSIHDKRIALNFTSSKFELSEQHSFKAPGTEQVIIPATY